MSSLLSSRHLMSRFLKIFLDIIKYLTSIFNYDIIYLIERRDEFADC